MAQKLYLKALHKGAAAFHHFGQTKTLDRWDQPKNGKAGEWKAYGGGPLRIHFNGIHLAKLEYAICWVHDDNYLAEPGGDIVEDFEAIVAQKARLVQKLEISSEDAAALAIQWAKDVVMLLHVMDYPAPFRDFPVAVFYAFESWAKTGQAEKPVSLARDITQLHCQAGQYARDAQRSIGYRYNSLAAQETCMALKTLGGLDMTRTNAEHNLRVAIDVAAHATLAVVNAAHHLSTHKTQKPPAFFSPFLVHAPAQNRGMVHDVHHGHRRRQSAELCQKFGLS